VSERGKEIPAVNVEVFERAFAAFRESVCDNPDEDAEISGIGAVLEVTGRGGEFMATCGRCFKLLDLIRGDKNVRIHKKFPSTWLSIAATAGVRLLEDFDVALFLWQEGAASGD
jgi:hypothetical protein